MLVALRSLLLAFGCFCFASFRLHSIFVIVVDYEAIHVVIVFLTLATFLCLCLAFLSSCCFDLAKASTFGGFSIIGDRIDHLELLYFVFLLGLKSLSLPLSGSFHLSLLFLINQLACISLIIAIAHCI